MLKRAEHDQVFQRHLRDVTLVANSPGGTGRIRFIIRVHCTILQTSAARSLPGVPVIRVVLAVGPLQAVGVWVREGCLAAVMRQLHCELAVGRKLKEFAWWRREKVAGAIVLEPPLFLGKLVQGIDGGVGVRVVGASVATFTVHTVRPGGGMGGCEGSKSGTKEDGRKHFRNRMTRFERRWK